MVKKETFQDIRKRSLGDNSFIDRQGKLVRPTKEEFNSQIKNYGEAYGFFKCNASAEEIESEFPIIRRLSLTPSELELYLIEEKDFKKDKTLNNYIFKNFGVFGVNYTLKARYPNATNLQTADELSAILNQIYKSPLYEPGEKFFGDICYKNKGRYEFRD
jgi:hypothetical protein